MTRMFGLNDYPLSLFSKEGDKGDGIYWIQNSRDSGFGPVGKFCEPSRRIHIDFRRGGGFEPLFHALLDLMERDYGGHPDHFDPMKFTWISTTKDEKVSEIRDRNLAWVNGGTKDGVNIQFSLYGFTSIAGFFSGRRLLLPIRTSQPFNWKEIGAEDFERLMFRLFSELDFENVQWLQKTYSPDGGRDISAIKKTDKTRVLIQAKHQIATLNEFDVSHAVVKAETWYPPFDEVMIVTTSTFTQGAVRWMDCHNANPGNRPLLKLEPQGHLEVMLCRLPHLIAQSGLRN